MLASNPIGASIAAGLNKIHDSWGWFIALGIALIVLGSVCILGDVTATLATVLAFGWLLIMGAIVALIQAFQVRSWSGFFLLFLSALLRGFTGYMLVRYPLAGGIRSDPAARVALHRRRRVPGNWRRRTEVPAVGLGGVLGDRLRGAWASCCSRSCRYQASGSSEWPSVLISFSMAGRSLPSARRCAEFRAADPSRSA